MGVVRTWESRRAELEAFRRKVVAAAVVHRRKDLEPPRCNSLFANSDDGDEGTLVCVTSGVSYLGLALVNQLLQRGYSVRITVDNPGTLSSFLPFPSKQLSSLWNCSSPDS